MTSNPLTQSQQSTTGFSAVKRKDTLYQHLPESVEKGKNVTGSGASETIVEEEILPPLPELTENESEA